MKYATLLLFLNVFFSFFHISYSEYEVVCKIFIKFVENDIGAVFMVKCAMSSFLRIKKLLLSWNIREIEEIEKKCVVETAKKFR